MSKVITPQENPEEYHQAMGFVQQYQDSKKLGSVDSHFISKNAIQQFMDNPDFDAFKVHHARNDDGTRNLIFEGINNKGESLEQFVSQMPPCPPDCSWNPKA